MAIPTRSKLLILTAVMASLLEIIDTSIVNVAVPTMMGNLGATLDEINWVLTGYIIANAIVLPIASWMSEQFGRKLYYTACIIAFTAASVACGMAPNLQTLVVFRVIQGFAGGALLPTSQALIYEAFPREQAGMASAIYGMSVMVGPTIGPTLGGYLTDHFGWRSIFNINLPIGIVVAFLAWFLVEDVEGRPVAAQIAAEAPAGHAGKKNWRTTMRERKRRPVDGIGLALLVVGIGCAQFVLERGHAEDWFDSNWIIVCTIAATVSLISLVWWELKVEHPILQLRHFRDSTFRSGIMLMAALGCMLYGLMFLIPIFVSTVQGFTATQTGELFIPGALASAAMMPIIGIQLKKRDPRILLAIGILLLAYAAFRIAHFDSQTSVDGMFWALLFRGAAMAFIFVPINSTVLSQFTGAAIGEAAGLLNLCRQLGGSISIALLSTLFQQSLVRKSTLLGAHLTPFDAPAMQALRGMKGSLQVKMPALVGVGSPQWGSSNGGLQILAMRAHREAFVLSFQRVMMIAVMIFLCSIIPMMSLRARKPISAKAAEAAH